MARYVKFDGFYENDSIVEVNSAYYNHLTENGVKNPPKYIDFVDYDIEGSEIRFENFWEVKVLENGNLKIVKS